MKKRNLTVVLLCLFSILSVNAQLLYKIEKPGNQKPSYIFGTHHLAPMTIAEEKGVTEKIDEVDCVVGEIDFTQDPMTLAFAMQQYMVAPSDSALSTLFTEEEYKKIGETFSRWSPQPGVTLEMLDILRPMVITSMMTVKMATEAMPEFNPEEQLDLTLLKSGKDKGKEVKGLETPAFQAEMLYTSQPISVQAEDLLDFVNNPEENLQMAGLLTEAYIKGDLEEMVVLSEKENTHPEFMELLLDKRNSIWLEQIPEIIDSNSSLIVVGALHLPGEKGLLKGLENKGYKVTPVE